MSQEKVVVNKWCPMVETRLYIYCSFHSGSFPITIPCRPLWSMLSQHNVFAVMHIPCSNSSSSIDIVLNRYTRKGPDSQFIIICSLFTCSLSFTLNEETERQLLFVLHLTILWLLLCALHAPNKHYCLVLVDRLVLSWEMNGLTAF